MMKRLAAVGDNCVDVYDQTGEAFPGGNPVNVAVYFTRLGGKASYTGAVGTDPYADMLLRALTEKGVELSRVHRLEGSTAVTHVELRNGDRILGEYDPGVLPQFRLSQEDIDFICTHDMMVTGLWSMVENDLEKIHARGVPIAFDFADKPRDPVVDIAIGYVDYAFFGLDLSDGPELRNFLKETQARGPKIVVATLGERGSVAWDGKIFVPFGIVPCRVVDTMGAGDSYIAGFLKGILEERPIAECMRLGAECSSVTLRYSGAW